MTDQRLNVLFLCNHNWARSLLAEATLRHLGAHRFAAWSAGSQAQADGLAHPLALRALQDAGLPTEGLHSKSWEPFAQPQAPHMDLVITLCDATAAEVCPVWPGHPATAHWSYPDPTLVSGDEDEQLHAFKQVLLAIHQRMELLVSLPPQSLERMRLQDEARRLAQA